MAHYTSLEAVSLTGSWLTIGVFDGIHRGHQAIIHQLTAGAQASGAPAVLLTFAPHPAQVLTGREIPCLTTPDERVEILLGLGLDHVITLPFTRELSNRSAEDFMTEIKKHLGLRNLIIGYDFALGKGRAGNFQRLSEIGKTLDYQVQAVESVRLEGETVSSTSIRQNIVAGEVGLAAVKLGRYYAVQGPVIHGDGRGRSIGVLTANLELPALKALPANGVYATWARLPGRERLPAVTNIGLRPTFTGGRAVPRVEALLLNFSEDLYGQPLKLEFVERLRGEQKFPSVAALIDQIQVDSQHAKEILT